MVSTSTPVIRTTPIRKPAAVFARTRGFDAVGSIRATTDPIGTAGGLSVSVGDVEEIVRHPRKTGGFQEDHETPGYASVREYRPALGGSGCLISVTGQPRLALERR